jgi:hypothetical protein
LALAECKIGNWQTADVYCGEIVERFQHYSDAAPWMVGALGCVEVISVILLSACVVFLKSAFSHCCAGALDAAVHRSNHIGD